MPPRSAALDRALQHLRAGRLQEAEQIYREILADDPNHFEAIHHLGIIAHQARQYELSAELIRRALAINPNSADAHSNLGNALRDTGQIEPAFAAYRQAIALRADFPEAHNNLGNALGDLGQLDEAAAAYRKAISLRPHYAKAHFNLALALLAQGKFAAGWDEYEWRWKYKQFLSSPRNFPQPRWDGGPLSGQTILLHAEQGSGDAIQFIRYLPLVVERCRLIRGQVILEVPSQLVHLFQTIPEIASGECRVVTRGQPLPHFDVHSPLLSLPRAFKTHLATIPATVPYLFPDSAAIDEWSQKLIAAATGLRIGLVWAGSPTHIGDRARSLALSCFSPLSNLPGMAFFSLQQGAAAAEARSAPLGLTLIDWASDFRDFSDAALIASLDLVITVDTAAAHLAGALGRPTWVLLPFVPDWRWMREREDSPWYPTMRLFRQPRRGDWASVIERVSDELIGLLRDRT